LQRIYDEKPVKCYFYMKCVTRGATTGGSGGVARSWEVKRVDIGA